MRRRRLLTGLGLALLLTAGCQTNGAGSSASTGTGSASSSGSTGAGTSSGAGPSTGTAGSTGTTTGGRGSTGASGSATGTAAGSSAGSTTGYLPERFIDGGYVFCEAAPLDDAGDLSPPWMCPAGTYFCGAQQTCAQCRSDTDCANSELPTFDAHRARCDLSSGVSGYQGFCQQCLENADCAGEGVNDQCNLNGALVFGNLDEEGFEACANLGVGCAAGSEPGLGGCLPSSCTTDADCALAVSSGTERNALLTTPQQAKPFCVAGQCSNRRDAGYFCPNCLCEHDTFCRDPSAVCDVSNDHCGCTDSSQCGGAWPICELADAGALGACGCASDADCGDAGLACLELPATSLFYGGRACLFSCNDPRFPGCVALTPANPVCDAPSGLCVPCQNNAECAQSGGTGPYCLQDGTCGCKVDGDCPHAETCSGSTPGMDGGTFGSCVPPPLACTPASCEGFTCDWDSGLCLSSNSLGQTSCIDDFDCALAASFCELQTGGCERCRNQADCVASGEAAAGASTCFAGGCTGGCAANGDCTGNQSGPRCVRNLYGNQYCGCATDADCSLDLGGLHCITDPSNQLEGRCGCQVASDCSPGLFCGVANQVCAFCVSDAQCAAGFDCAPDGRCHPRCDDGGGECQPPFAVCDTDNRVGLGTDGGPMCYQCLTGADCPVGQVCSDGTCYSNAECFADSACHAGEVCTSNYECQVACGGDAGECPTGSVCDTSGSVGPPGLCYQCLSPFDCPNEEGCDSRTHTCGACEGPAAAAGGGFNDCPPGTLCSAYWKVFAYEIGSGVCLQSCDSFACQNPADICAVFPSLSRDHKYCFGCLQDSDCTDAGAGWRCDTSVKLSFTCKPPGPF